MTPKRRHRRFGLALAADSGAARLEDLSMGGLRLLSNRALKIDQVFKTSIPWKGEAIRIEARIVRAILRRDDDYRYEFGAEITDLGKEEQTALEALIDELSRESLPLPEEPGYDDLEHLQHEIGDLRKTLIELENRHAAELDRREKLDPEAKPIRDARGPAFRTSFGAARFEHLARLGQPMMRITEEPILGLVGRRYALVGEEIDELFDLPALKAKLGRSLTEEVILETLHDLYERQRIDFA